MAKKSRRAKKRARQKRSIPAIRPKQPARETEALAEEKAAELAEEYRYVYSDLKRIAILAGVMLAALIILSFVIR
jgi:hypothetical protein